MRHIRKFFISENVQQAKSLLNKLGVNPEKDENFSKIKNMLGNSTGYVHWFTKLFFVDKVDFTELKNICEIIKTEPQIISKFEKPVVELENLEKFWDEYLRCKGHLNAKHMWDEFPSSQKKLVSLKNPDDLNLLNDLSKDKQKDIFLRKISRYHNRQELIKNLQGFLYNKTDNKFASLLSSLKSSGVKIKHADESNDIIVTTVDYTQLRKFGSDTSWCIVGSKGTFDAYNSSPLSQQFIIFLCDRSDNYSKIGVTTNVYGYHTAHLKNDHYLPKDKLFDVFHERGVNTNILFPSKEDIGEMNWSKIPVMVLINAGFTKEEIVAKKATFGNKVNYHAQESDLSFFTKEEIEKWDLLNKTELVFTDIKQYSKQEVLKKNLLPRVTDLRVEHLGELGFTLSEITKICDKLKLGDDLLISMIKGKTRKQLLRLLVDPFMSEYNIDYNSRDGYRKRLMSLIKITPEDISFENLYSRFNSRTFSDMNLLQRISFFSDFFPIGSKEIIKLISAHSSSDIVLSVSELVRSGNYVDNCIEIINSYKDYKFNYTEMNRLKNNLETLPDLYESIFNISKNNLIGPTKGWRSYYDLKISSESRYGGSRETDINSTMKNLDFWGAQEVFKLEDMGSVFDGIGISYCEDVIKYLIQKGYDLSGEDGFKFMEKIKKYNDNIIDFLGKCIDNSINVDDCYEKLLAHIKTLRGAVNSWDKSKIERLLKKRKEYEDKWEEFNNSDAINEAILKTKSASGYCWARDRNSEKPETWYEKYWPIIKKLNFNSINVTHDSYDHITLISTLVLLAKLEKVDDLNSIKYADFIKNQSSFRTPFLGICKIIADKNITNWKRTWMSLNLDQRKILYNWVSQRIKDVIKDDNRLWIMRSMSVCYYLFDKEKLNEFIKLVKISRNNYSYHGRNDVLRHKTIRPAELKGLFSYLGEEGKFEDMENILKDVTSVRMGKEEKTLSKGELSRASLNYSRKEGDDVYGANVSSQHKEKYKEILNKYLSVPEKLKESHIQSFKNFHQLL